MNKDILSGLTVLLIFFFFVSIILFNDINNNDSTYCILKNAPLIKEINKYHVPAFSVYLGNNQNVPNDTWTQLDFNRTIFDSYNDFNLTTNKFTPKIKGKYFLSAGVGFTLIPDGGVVSVVIRKNDINAKVGTYVTSGAFESQSSVVNSIFEANGTDYFDVWVIHRNTGTNKNIIGMTEVWTYFSGSRIGD